MSQAALALRTEGGLSPSYSSGALTPSESIAFAREAANACRQIVTARSVKISGRKYIEIEGWQTIAAVHGCVLSCSEPVPDGEGYRVEGQVRKIADGSIIAVGHGYCGRDEATWRKRDDYAIRAMAQTRAMSRAARSAFAYIVVLIDPKMSTRDPEEDGGETEEALRPSPPRKAHTKPEDAPVCPECGSVDTVTLSQYPKKGKWYCHKNNGGCGAQFDTLLDAEDL